MAVELNTFIAIKQAIQIFDTWMNYQNERHFLIVLPFVVFVPLTVGIKVQMIKFDYEALLCLRIESKRLTAGI